MKTLLVASDLSPRSDRAVARAFVLARAMDARLIVVDVLPATASEAEAVDLRDRLHRFCLSIKGAEQVNFVTRTPQGDTVAALLALARTENAEMVILGLHEQRALLDGLRGTTMEHLLQDSHLPVLLVHDPADHPYDNLLAAVDFRPSCGTALRVGRKLLEGNRIRMLHAVHIPYQATVGAGAAGEPPVFVDPTPFLKAAQDEARAWMAREGFDAPPEVTVVEGAVEHQLRHAAAAERPDLITMGAHIGTGPIDRLLGSAVADLMREPPCDLLVVRA